MLCMTCQKELTDCVCPDIDERLARISTSRHFVYRACLRCKKHYARCRCVEPTWGLSTELARVEGVKP